MSAQSTKGPALENDASRVDVHAKVTGAARFAADVLPKGTLWARFIRFPHGKGRLAGRDLDAARAVPGVVEVEIESKKADYTGARLGYVLAESEDALGDALEALAPRFEWSDDARSAPSEADFKPPKLPAGRQKELDRLFARAGAVVEATYTTQVQTHSSLEPHNHVVIPKGRGAEVWSSTQAIFSVKDGMAKTFAGGEVVVRAPYVGGGFGSKFGAGAEGKLAARLAKKHKRPVKVLLTRREEHLDTGNRPGSIQVMKIAASASGKLLGGHIHNVGIVGQQPGAGGVRNPILYDFGDVEVTSREVTLNAGRPRAFRAPGFPQAVFAVESLMDELAAKLNKDPVELRLLNETSARRKSQLKLAAERIGWRERRPDGTWPGVRKRGYGCGGTLWKKWPTECEAGIDVYRDGRVVVRSGIVDIGTGTRTIMIDIAARELGIDRKLVSAYLGDTREPAGPGSGGSQTARSVAPAIMSACARVKAAMKRQLKEGGDWKAACRLLPNEKLTEVGRVEDRYLGEGTTDGVQFAMVEVDTETGVVFVEKIVAVQCCGLAINRLTAENQVEGGVIQGIGYALFEEKLLDPGTGAMLNANYEQYRIPGAVDIPEIDVILDVRPEDTGVRGLGEPPTIPTAGAIANAVANAIGARVRDLPITPQRVLAALGGGR